MAIYNISNNNTVLEFVYNRKAPNGCAARMVNKLRECIANKRNSKETMIALNMVEKELWMESRKGIDRIKTILHHDVLSEEGIGQAHVAISLIDNKGTFASYTEFLDVVKVKE